MSKKTIKVAVLTLVTIVLLLIGFLKSEVDYIGHIILSVIVIQGAMAICDFFLGLPITVAYARLMEPSEKNMVGRIVFLIIAIILMIFAFWWILFDKQLTTSLMEVFSGY